MAFIQAKRKLTIKIVSQLSDENTIMETKETIWTEHNGALFHWLI